MAKKKKLWIQKAIKPSDKGKLHQQLGISPSKEIPLGLLSKIKKAPVGSTVKYGQKSYKVTGLLKKRAVLAYTLKTFRR